MIVRLRQPGRLALHERVFAAFGGVEANTLETETDDVGDPVLFLHGMDWHMRRYEDAVAPDRHAALTSFWHRSSPTDVLTPRHTPCERLCTLNLPIAAWSSSLVPILTRTRERIDRASQGEEGVQCERDDDLCSHGMGYRSQ